MEWFEKKYIHVDIINEIFLVHLKNTHMYMHVRIVLVLKS